jgi:hypothetical protein
VGVYNAHAEEHERVANESGVFAYYNRATQRIIRAVVKPCTRGLMVSRKRKDDLPSVTVAWPTKPASAFLAFIGDNRRVRALIRPKRDDLLWQ